MSSKLYEEMTLHVSCSPLTESPPGNTTSMTCATQTACYYGSSFTVTLTRESRNLAILVTWVCGYGHDYNGYNRRAISPPGFTSMTFVHHKRGIISLPIKPNMPINSYPPKLVVPVDMALRGKMYDFEIVLSTEPTLSRSFKLPLSSDTIADDETDDSIGIAAGPSQAIMKTLLADRHSVDVQFIFTADRTCSNVGLWAHRTILSRYKLLGDLINKTLKDQLAKDDDVSPLTIRVEKFSLAAFACLIYYFYTGSVKRTMNSSNFAFSQQDEAVVVIKDESTGRTKERVHWNPLDADSSWKMKDVTWTELLFISEYFGVKDLRDECIHEVIESIKDSNVVELLFDVGCYFDKIKEATLTYLADNMESMCGEGKDPFEKYRDHEHCHALMLDTMRYKSVPASRRVLSLTSTVRTLAIGN
ncbi:hypothetical protein EC991_001110 [Linnemannia zychae]|nr:hypothetical protein EC991_001110 [Linnemannia zychae]